MHACLPRAARVLDRGKDGPESRMDTAFSGIEKKYHKHIEGET